MLDLAIIGAGPYGLSLAAHAKEAGLQYKVFGYPMDFWKSKMPPKMFIRTLLDYTALSDPLNEYTLKKFESEKNLNLSYPLPRSIFVNYGMWFIEKTNISIEKKHITYVLKNKHFFELKTEKGDHYQAKNVVVAVGLTNAKYIPSNLSSLPEDLVFHSSDYTDFRKFKNKHVLVIGGGQSAWESAALLHQANAKVELAYRRPKRLSPDKNMNAKQLELADKYYYFSLQEKEKIRKYFERPTVSDFLVPLVEGKVTQRPNTFITQVLVKENNLLDVTFNDNSNIVVEHILAATGFRFSVKNLPFLKSMINKIKVNDIGEPIVNENFESTVSHLFFAGPATAYSHGPTFRFIAGVRRTSEVLINHIKSHIKLT